MIKELDVYDLYEQLVELGLFTAEELKLLTRINGYNIETLNNAVYARYGVGGMKLIIKFLQKGKDNNV